MPPSSSPGSPQSLSVDGREVPPPPPPGAVKEAVRGGARGGADGPSGHRKRRSLPAGAQPGGSRGLGLAPLLSAFRRALCFMSLKLGFTLGTVETTDA